MELVSFLTQKESYTSNESTECNNSNTGNETQQSSIHHDILSIFKISQSSIQVWKQKYLDKPISYKWCIIDFKRRDSEYEPKIEDYSSNISEYVNSKSKVEIAVLNENECKFNNQNQFGRVFDPDEYVFIKASIDDMNKWAYMVDFYVQVNKTNNPTCLPVHIGSTYILPLNLQEDNGTINAVITGNNHKPIGQFIADYLIVKPLQGYSNTLVNLNNWKNYKQGSLEVGHRGAGKWRRTDKIENVLENTIASFNYAAKHGADMVELDVHLSKDKVPVIYHDFTITISIKKKINSSDTNLNSDVLRFTHAVKDLTLKELQLLKLSPVNNQNHDFCEMDPFENQPFPTLQQVLKSVPDSCGFNVEIKYPSKKIDDQWEGPYNRDLSENEFVDIILNTLIEEANQRNIILSTFHPDICTLLRLKQNKFPVLFLTNGKTNRYTPYKDPRCKSLQNAVYLSKIFNFWGVNAHAEELFNNLSLIKYVKNFDLKLFTWGEDINSKKAVNQLKTEGVDGIIYDKIDVYNTKFLAVDSNLGNFENEEINKSNLNLAQSQSAMLVQ